MEQFIHQYIALTQQKQERQKNITWLSFWDPQHRLQGLINEVQEVSDELRLNNQVYLEDELWDIFWNYMNFLTLLESKGYITSTDTVLQQSYTKFQERTSAVINKTDKLSSDIARDEVKKLQKEQLEQKHKQLYK
jgi:NTP pyrophosphatase (non-canonical NTP hydrolase)